MTTVTSATAHVPPTAMAPAADSDDEQFHDARESLSSSGLIHAPVPQRYSRVEPLSTPIAPPENELSIFRLAKEVLGSVKPGADVTNINLPASILDPMSAMEKSRTSMQRGELLQDLCAAPDSISRMLNVLRFNISGLAKERFGKKPYNPILGEVYRCCFPHRGAGGETLLIAEQVSHHPPVTALHVRNDTLGFQMNSYTAPEPRFWGNSLEVRLSGEIRMLLTKFDEEYVITRPFINMTGFLAGRQRLEFNGTSTLTCEKSGLGAELDYKARGSLTIRPEMHGISGRVFDLATKETLFTLEGHWDRKIVLTDMRTKQQRPLFDYDAILADKSMVALMPVPEEEEETFSTKVWAWCSEAIKKGDSAAANAEKRKIEEAQRQQKKEREAAGIEWQWRYFKRRDDGREGYLLRDDVLSGNFTKLQLQPKDLEGLRSGETVKQMQAEMGREEGTSAEAKKIGHSRLKLLGRGRAKA